MPTGLEALPGPGARAALYLVVEAIEKPGNLGAMIRTADGAGSDGLIVADPAVDPFGPNVIRASLGSVFSLPTAVATSSDTIDWLRRHHVAIVATTPDATIEWSQADLTGSIACIIGAEHQGLSEAWIEAADHRVFVPMHGVGDSLNAAATAAIVLYEAVRQRSH
jgi:TrmH family RNA methyltransferase